MLKIDLNCDLGESFGAYTIGLDEDILPHISSANVACGFHASDPVVMAKTVALCKAAGVAVGAHPGYPDLQGFGRRNLSVSPKELKAMVQYQIGALQAFCTANGVSIQHVKPHGAMYNMAGKDESLAMAICEGILEVDQNLILLGLSGSKLLEAAGKAGLKAVSEVFADRAYREDGSLVPRGMPGAMIEEEDKAVARVIRMAKEGLVTANTGRDISIRADSVCVHGDSPGALIFVQKIRTGLRTAGITVAPVREIIG